MNLPHQIGAPVGGMPLIQSVWYGNEFLKQQLHFSYVANLFIVAVMLLNVKIGAAHSPNYFAFLSLNSYCNVANFAHLFIFGKPKNMLEKSCILRSHEPRSLFVWYSLFCKKWLDSKLIRCHLNCVTALTIVVYLVLTIMNGPFSANITV